MAHATFPTGYRINNTKNITFIPRTMATSFSSPFTGQTQVVRYSGQFWELDVQFNPLLQVDAEALFAFLVGLNGMDGKFYYQLPNKFLMDGSLSITVTGNGNTFTTSGTPQVGKFGCTGERLVCFTSATTIFPRLPTGNYTIGTSSKPVFRLAIPEQSYEIDYMMMGAFSMNIVEAI